MEREQIHICSPQQWVNIKSWDEISEKVVRIQGDDVEEPRLLYEQVGKLGRTQKRGRRKTG